MLEMKKNFKSVRFKLFFTMCIVIAVIVLCLIAVNNIVLESFYLYSKTKTVLDVYNKMNTYYSMDGNDKNIEEELRRIAYNNNFDIYIETDDNIIVFSTDRDLYSTIDMIANAKKYKDNDVIYSDDKVKIAKVNDKYNNISYIRCSTT